MPDTVIIFLEDPKSKGFQLDQMTMLPDPAITQLTSQTGLYHISTNLEIQRVAERLYQANCETEAKAIKNWQNLLALSHEGISLKPYFDTGYTGTSVHEVHKKSMAFFVHELTYLSP